MKKLLALILALMMSLSLAACGAGGAQSAGDDAAQEPAAEEPAAEEEAEAPAEADAETPAEGTADVSGVKIGVIYIGDEQEAYTANHYNGILAACESLGIDPNTQLVNKWHVPESEEAADALADLADSGCNIIFATSFGHEDYVLQVATEYPEVQFFHATGYQAASSGIPNVYNYFADIYQARYLGGVVAGLKLQSMIDDGVITEDQAKVGYVGAFPFAEVVSGYTAFYLGVRSACPAAVMQVSYVNSWSDAALESEAAEALISDGCVIISQHSDTTGPATTCEKYENVYFVGYNLDMVSVAPTSCLTSAKINWAIPMEKAIADVLAGAEVPKDMSFGMADNGVEITPLNTDIIAPGTEETVAATEAALSDGSLKVFDTSTFTVNGETVTTTATDDLAATYYGNEYIIDGAFAESTLASAPAFAFRIDGITENTEG